MLGAPGRLGGLGEKRAAAEARGGSCAGSPSNPAGRDESEHPHQYVSLFWSVSSAVRRSLGDPLAGLAVAVERIGLEAAVRARCCSIAVEDRARS